MIAVRLERKGEIEGGFVHSNGDVRLYITDAGRDALKPKRPVELDPVLNAERN